MFRKIWLIFLLPGLAVLIGCASEVDKCVESQLRVYDKEWSLDQKARKSRTEYEAQARYICLQAAGKNN